MDSKKNYVFIGEAGSGKSEVAVNFAIKLAKETCKKVHFFDMDQTKPLFRTRDIKAEIESKGIVFHCEEQFMDAPTLVGGVNLLLKDEETYVVMDIGGDYIGARSIGGYASYMNKDNTDIYYVLNTFRPWSDSIEHIDETLSSILYVSHICLEKVKVISNPNKGIQTVAEDVIEGNSKLIKILKPHFNIEFVCVKEDLYDEVKLRVETPIFPIQLFMTYEWNQRVI